MDGQNSLDVSADLLELSRCAIMVVSAGVKSILDVGRTLEYLVSTDDVVRVVSCRVCVCVCFLAEPSVSLLF